MVADVETDSMMAVSKEEFFEYLKKTPVDIMPHNRHTDYTDWEDRSRKLYGRSYPGWKRHGDPRFPKFWYLTKTAFYTLYPHRKES